METGFPQHFLRDNEGSHSLVPYDDNLRKNMSCFEETFWIPLNILIPSTFFSEIHITIFFTIKF